MYIDLTSVLLVKCALIVESIAAAYSASLRRQVRSSWIFPQPGLDDLFALNALTYFQNVFIIIRNKDLTENIKRDFPEIRIVNAYIYTDIPQVVSRLKNAGYSEDKINK